MSWEFKPGMKVEWYRGEPKSYWPKVAREYLKPGREYVIAGVHDPVQHPGLRTPFLSFEDSPVGPDEKPMQFDSRGFRQLLTPSKQKEGA